jgi:glycosyltransferase involved in cell wall biosynthesis
MADVSVARMRILFFTDNFPPETNAPASRTHEHTKRWAAAGHQVTVVTTAPNFPEGKVFAGYHNGLWTRQRIDNVDVIRLWTYVTANEGFIRRSLDYASFMVSAILAAPFLPRPDVVISTSPQFFTPCAAYVVSRFFRRPWIFELRDLWPDSIVAVGAMKENALIRGLRKIEYFLYRRSSKIVSVTHSFRHVLCRNGISEHKIAVVPNGADLETYQPGPRPDALAARLGFRGKFVAAYVGTIGMAHGLATLLDAAERLRDRDDIVFVLVGTGAEEKSITTEARRRGLTNVHFVGSVTKAEVLEYWLLCDVALVLLRDTPTFRHVIPSKMFEAMSTARPIILGVRGESEAILNESGAGLAIPPEDAQALAAAIVTLADDRTRRYAMGTAGRAYVSRKFDRDVLAQQMLTVIEEAALGRSGL